MKFKSLIISLSLIALSVLSLTTATAAWFNFNNAVRDIEVITDNLDISALSNSTLYKRAKEESMDISEVPSSFDVTISPLNAGFSMNYFDPYYKRFFTSDEPYINTFVSASFSVNFSTNYKISLNINYQEINSYKKVSEWEYEIEPKTNVYKLSQIVKFSAALVDTLPTNSTNFKSNFSNLDSSYVNLWSIDLANSEEILTSSQTINLLTTSNINSDTTTNYTLLININYDTDIIDAVSNYYGEVFTIDRPSFGCDFNFNLSVEQVE